MAKKLNPEAELLARLREAADQIAILPEVVPPSRAGKARAQISSVVEELGRVLVELDPVREIGRASCRERV